MPRSLLLIVLLVACFATSGCFSLFSRLPESVDASQRVADLPIADAPVKATVRIRWTPNLIPYIEAANDHDGAVAMGMVHAHLRLGQMELLRLASQGRLAEGLGPLLTDVDKSIRILDFGRPTDDIIAMLPERTRAFLDAYLSGINHVVASYDGRDPNRPIELKVFGRTPEPWTLRDLVILGRLAAHDVNWLGWISMLESSDEAAFAELEERLAKDARLRLPVIQDDDKAQFLSDLLAGSGKTGSNAFAVAAERSASGGALLASDPHLGVEMPSMWLALGLRTPTFNLVGLSIPGLPVFGIGRSQHVSWGGTSLRAWSTDFVSLSPDDVAAAAHESEDISVRWWFDSSVTRRWTPWGPIINDMPLFSELEDQSPLALRWIGHLATDEFTALMDAARAKTVPDFRQALAPFAVPGQSMLAADTAGNIGLIVMASLPERDPSAGRSIVKSSSEPKHRWGAILGPTDFPMALNPESGAIVSANNPPFLSDPSLGWYSGEHDRFQRATALLGERDDLNPEDLMALQQDVVSPEAAALAAQIVELAQSADLSAGQQALVDDLKGWDGSYAADQRAALVFQALQGELANLLFTDRYGAALNEVVLESTLSVAWLGEELRTHTAARSAVLTALGDVAWDLPAEATWGDHHRMRLAHPFAILPLVGRRYVTATWGADGGASTLMKTAGPTGGKAHDVSFGQNARFVTDMADPDATWLCMLGGNDGHIGSEAWDDQVDDWRAGRYLQLPLTPARIETLCPWVSELAPAADH